MIDQFFKVILNVFKILFILLLFCAFIICGVVILAIVGIEVPNGEFIVNVMAVPLLLFNNKIINIIFTILFISVIVSYYVYLRNLVK